MHITPHTDENPQVEQWDIFEVALNGPNDNNAKGQDDGNPFVDITFGARFQYGHRVVEARGFYDGDGVYRVRFMPDVVGEWSFVTYSNVAALDGHKGTFRCDVPRPDNHGPVYVHDTYHFAYADGTPHVSVGTTCYAWVHQGDALAETTVVTLRDAPFNKMRMCIFPKHYAFNQNEPELYPYVRATDDKAGDDDSDDKKNTWDFTRFNPAYFRNIEQRVGQLLALGIEADLILFHSYDRWGFADMVPDHDDHYLRYVVARLAAFRNVWWSMANEFDIMKSKEMSDWDRFFRIVQEEDPYQRLRSIHNCRGFYDHNKPWVTHQSIQHSDLAKVPEWRNLCHKPVVVDECQYEGNIERGWGNISAQELVHRFWLGTVGGGYVGHGETYLHPEDILWWSKGGVLHGESPARIAFLRELLAQNAPCGLTPLPRVPGAACDNAYFLYYFGVAQPGRWPLQLPAGKTYALDVIDTWNMTVAPVEGRFSGECWVDLPSKPYYALQVKLTG